MFRNERRGLLLTLQGRDDVASLIAFKYKYVTLYITRIITGNVYCEAIVLFMNRPHESLIAHLS